MSLVMSDFLVVPEVEVKCTPLFATMDEILVKSLVGLGNVLRDLGGRGRTLDPERVPGPEHDRGRVLVLGLERVPVCGLDLVRVRDIDRVLARVRGHGPYSSRPVPRNESDPRVPVESAVTVGDTRLSVFMSECVNVPDQDQALDRAPSCLASDVASYTAVSMIESEYKPSNRIPTS